MSTFRSTTARSISFLDMNCIGHNKNNIVMQINSAKQELAECVIKIEPCTTVSLLERNGR